MPILKQLSLVNVSPFQHKPKLPSGESALDHVECVNANLCTTIRVARVEVGRSVVIEVDGDGNPKESADRGHRNHRTDRLRWDRCASSLRGSPLLGEHRLHLDRAGIERAKIACVQSTSDSARG